MLGALNWSFQEADSHRVDSLLAALLEECGADRALLVDRTGQLIASTGAGAALDPTAFASLAAADFAANEQLARLLGAAHFSSLYHQGPRESLFLASVADRAILAVGFGRGVTLGMVRIRVRRALPELEALFAEVFARPQGRSGAALATGWASEAEAEIDRLFDGG